VDQAFTLAVRSTHDAIAPASAAAEAWLQRHGAGPRTVFLIQLAIEELVTNCIKYAYDDAAGHTIAIALALDGPSLTMTVVDDGRPFNPLTVPPPDLASPIEDRPIGGLGLHLVREMAAGAIAYQRLNGKNRLTLTTRMT